MKIFLTHGKGEGATKLAAFDAALWDAGIANYNLIKLSSVIPDDAEIVHRKLDWNNQQHGYKLYCVMAQSATDVIGRKASAGIGWSQVENGRGIFVEHHGNEEEEVRKQIEATITSMLRYREEGFGEIKHKIETAECRGVPVCVVVAAVYVAEGWEQKEKEIIEELPSFVGTEQPSSEERQNQLYL